MFYIISMESQKNHDLKVPNKNEKDTRQNNSGMGRSSSERGGLESRKISK